MSDNFQCLVDGSHDFSLKARRGTVCRLCGLVSLPGSHSSYKSYRYSHRVHFSITDYENVLHEEDHGLRITNHQYLETRERMIRFILDKGRALKMSLKTLHLAVYIMDAYCERSKSALATKDEFVIAACSLLVAAKSGELDERIPFISKLKKYTGLTNDAYLFKQTEVAIAECLNWDLQKVTFYSFVEFYMTAGMVVPQDRISRKVLDSLSLHGVEDTVRLLAREEQSRQRLTLDSIYKPACSSSVRDASDAYSSRDECVSLSSLDETRRSDVIKVFELYARDLSNLVLREFRYWSYSKNQVALSILLYTRASVFETNGAWNTRMKDLSGLSLPDIREAFVRISDFISTGEKEATSTKHYLVPPGTSPQGHSANLLQYCSYNSQKNNFSSAQGSQGSQGFASYSTQIPTPLTELQSNIQSNVQSNFDTKAYQTKYYTAIETAGAELDGWNNKLYKDTTQTGIAAARKLEQDRLVTEYSSRGGRLKEN